MRVGYLTYGLDRSPAGIARYAVELLRAIAAQAGAPEMVLLTTEAADRHGLWPQFEHHPLPGCRLLPALLTAGNFAIPWAVKRYGLDLVHDPNGIAPFLGPRTNAPLIVTVHDAFAFVHPQEHNRLDNWRYRYLLPRAVQRASRVLTDSAQSQADLSRYLKLEGEAIEVVYIAAEPRFSPQSEANDAAIIERHGLNSPYLFYVGGLNARKNVAGVLRSFALARAKHPELTLAIGGARQWQTAGIDLALREPELAAGVKLLGYVPDADLPALYRGAAVFAFPSLYEGFGLPVLEAMASGTPVVTSNRSSLPEVAGDAALLVDPRDNAAIAAAICRILEDAALAADLRARGLQRAGLFSWQRAAQQSLDAYRQALGIRQEVAA